MFITKLKRVTYVGFVNILRAPFVSFSAIFVMSVTLFVVGFSFLIGNILDDSVEDLENKIDLTVFFVKEAPEDQILSIKSQVEDLSIVREVFYISKEAALEEYKTRHENNPTILEGLEILNENPFRARISITSYDPSNFDSIDKFVKNADILGPYPTTIIDKTDYFQNRNLIDRLASIVNSANNFSKIIIILLGFITFLIVFNIVRLIIYLSREEIQVMKIIGADESYIKTPFLFSGMVYGVAGSVLSIIILYPIVLWISPVIEEFFIGVEFVGYYSDLFLQLVLLNTFIGVFVGVLSSWLSTRRYLN